MAGTIIADFIRTDANQLSLNVGNTTFATINASGFFSNTGTQLIAANGQISGASLVSGSITSAAFATAANTIPRSSMTTGAVLQVVSTTKTDSFSLAATNTFTDITGLSVEITPTSTTSKIYVVVSVGGASQSAGGTQAYRLVRGSTAIGVGTASGNRQATSWRDGNGNTDTNISYGGRTFAFLDSPATVSATTYKLQLIVQDATGYINRSAADTDISAPYGTRAASTITVMEIAA